MVKINNVHSKVSEIQTAIEDRRKEELESIVKLQEDYTRIMGEPSSEIQLRTGDVDKKYNAKSEKLGAYVRRYNRLTSFSDNGLRILNSNGVNEDKDFGTFEGTVNFEDDPVYSRTSEVLQRKIRERGKDSADIESEYWSVIFPEDSDLEEKTTQAITPIQLPELTEPKILTLREELEKTTDLALKEKVETAVAYVNQQVGPIYDLHSLSSQELFELQQGLERFNEMPSNQRLERTFDFVNAYLPPDAWNGLSAQEQDLIHYTRLRDKNSDPGEFRAMTRDREERLATTILKAYTRMVDRHGQYRQSPIPTSQFPDKNGNAGQVLFVEQWLTEKIDPYREDVYSQVTDQNLRGVLDFHSGVEARLTPEEMQGVNVGYQVNKMRNLSTFYEGRHSLSTKQRQFAFDLMTQYIASISNLPDVLMNKLAEPEKPKMITYGTK